MCQGSIPCACLLHCFYKKGSNIQNIHFISYVLKIALVKLYNERSRWLMKMWRCFHDECLEMHNTKDVNQNIKSFSYEYTHICYKKGYHIRNIKELGYGKRKPLGSARKQIRSTQEIPNLQTNFDIMHLVFFGKCNT